MKSVLHLGPLAQADPVAKVVHDDRQVIEVIADARGQGLLLAAPYDHLVGLVRGSPIELQRQLVRLDQVAFGSASQVVEEVDVPPRPGAIIVGCPPPSPDRAARDGSSRQLPRPRRVPGADVFRLGVGRLEGPDGGPRWRLGVGDRASRQPGDGEKTPENQGRPHQRVLAATAWSFSVQS